MFKLLPILVVFCLYGDVSLFEIDDLELPAKEYYKLDNVDGLFKDFSAEYNKQYDSHELIYRRKVFAENIIRINRWNREHQHTVFGINAFTDLTFEEFLETNTGLLGNFTSTDKKVEYVPKGNALESLDYRQKNYVTRVREQRDCGSCYVFSAIGSIEGQHAKAHGQLIELSEQQGLDCNPNGCQGGQMEQVMQSLATQGCMKGSDYHPYTARKGQCRTDRSKVVVRVTGGQALGINSEEALKDAVSNIGPLSIGLTITEEFKAYRGGIYRPSASGAGHHAVLLIGYGSAGGVPYWLIKNSWGQQWGENGFMRLTRGQRACEIGRYVVSASVA